MKVALFWQNDPKPNWKRARKTLTPYSGKNHRPAPIPNDQLAALMRAWRRG